MVPARCEKCGAVVEVTGAAWKFLSLVWDIVLMFTVARGLVVAIHNPFYGACAVVGAMVFWLVLTLATSLLGDLSVTANPPAVDDAQEAMPVAPKPVLGRFLWHGGLSGFVSGAWVISLFGMLVAMGIEDYPLAGLCGAVIVFAGMAARRLSPLLEKVHRCPSCGFHTISSWRKSLPPLFAGCPKCHEKYRLSGGALGWCAVIGNLLLCVSIISSIYFRSFLPFLFLGIIAFVWTLFVVNVLPIVPRRRTK